MHLDGVRDPCTVPVVVDASFDILEGAVDISRQEVADPLVFREGHVRAIVEQETAPDRKGGGVPARIRVGVVQHDGHAGVGNVAGRTEGSHSGTKDDHRFVAHHSPLGLRCQREWLPLVLSGSRLRVPSPAI